MSKRKLPAARMPIRPGVTSGASTDAVKRWNPDLRAATDDENTPTISVLDPIGADWFGDGVTAKRIAAALRNIGDRDVVVNINSPGGDYFEGLAIYNMLLEHPGQVTVKVLGLAASAASIIAMAADNLLVARAGFLMIHNTWVCACGDRHAFREVADWLEPFDAAAVDVYHARSGINEAELAKMLDKETWISGKDAVDRGLADGLLSDEDLEGKAANSTALSPLAAKKKMDTILASAGFSRSDSRALAAALNVGTHDAAPEGKPGAAPSGMQDAAVTDLAQSALDKLSKI